MHNTMDNGFIAAEMKAGEAEVAKKENERGKRKFHKRHKVALIVLNCLKHKLDNNVD